MFSSPYLIHYTDQISINGESIPEARLEALMADYQSLLEGESATNLQGTTEFETVSYTHLVLSGFTTTAFIAILLDIN